MAGGETRKEAGSPVRRWRRPSAGRCGGDGEEWARDVSEDGLRVRGEGGRCLMSGLCTSKGAVHVLSRDPWAGLSFSWKNVEGSHTFRFGDMDHEVPLGQVLERCQQEKASISSKGD